MSDGVRRFVPWGVGLVVLWAGLWLAAPGMYWLDSQELAAAAVRMGVPHPTGFPLHGWAGALASWIPVGELAFRVHLVSVAATAGAAVAVARLVAELSGDDAAATVGGAGAGLFVAASPLLFPHAVVTEVYAPTALLLAVSLLLCRRATGGGEGGRRAGLSLALLAGAAATGAHASYRLLLFAPLAALVIWRLRRGERWPLVAPALAVLGAGAVVVYLPLRSASGNIDLVDWSTPQTVGALWDHVSATRIRVSYAGQILQGVPEVVGHHAALFFRQVEGGLGVLGILVAAFGGVVLFVGRGARLVAAALALIVVGDAAYAIWVNPMGLVDGQNGAPLLVAMGVLAGVGVAAAGKRLGRAAPFASGALAVMVLVPVGLEGAGARGAVAASEAPRRWSERALAQAPPRALVLTRRDDTSAGLLWLQTAEEARPDLAVLVRQHVWVEARTRAALERVGLSAREPKLAAVVAAAEGAGRPVLWELADDAPPGGALDADLPMARLARAPGAPESRRALDAMARVFSAAALEDPPARRLLGDGLTALGRQAIWLGRADDALRLLGAAADSDGRSTSARINLGVLRQMLGDVAGAAAVTEEALAIDPNHAGALVNAARYRLVLGQDERAREHAARATRVAPDRADAWALLGVLEARAGNVTAARAHLARALALDPDNIDARENLKRLR